MSALFLLRHGPTEWTAARRLQGRSDIPLSAGGRGLVATWQLPDRAVQCEWVSSPLARATETAEILRRRYQPGGRFADRAPAGGNEFRRMGGTDPRPSCGRSMARRWRNGRAGDSIFGRPAARARAMSRTACGPGWRNMAAGNEDVLAITHKGVMRALYALASGWDMRGKPPHRLADNAVHEFELDRAGLRIGSIEHSAAPAACRPPRRPHDAPAGLLLRSASAGHRTSAPRRRDHARARAPRLELSPSWPAASRCRDSTLAAPT